MITKNLWAAGSVAAALAVSTGAAFAETSYDASRPAVPIAAYALLTNRTFDGVDIAQAKAEGYNDGQIATIAKIAHKTGLSFGEVKDRIASGTTFGVLADQYNLRLKDVWDNQDYKDRIAMYELAWNSTGKNALHEKVMASQETYTAPYTTTTPPAMNPNTTTTPPAMNPNNTAPTPTTTTTPAP